MQDIWQTNGKGGQHSKNMTMTYRRMNGEVETDNDGHVET